MNVRRLLLFLYFTTLLIFLYPKNFSVQRMSHDSPPEHKSIQIDTEFGSFLSDRFVGDWLLLPYVDAYGRVIDIRYVNTPHQIVPFETPDGLTYPLGMCLAMAKLQRGDYIPRKVIGVYTSNTDLSRPMTFDSLRFIDDFDAFCKYWEDNTEYVTEDLTEENLKACIEANDGAIIILDNTHPVFIYDYDVEFFAWDPVTLSDEFTLGASLNYHNGLLEFSGDKLVCLL